MPPIVVPEIIEMADPKSWFVMRDLKRANAKVTAYQMLQAAHYEVFTPLKWSLRIVGGRRIRKEVPIIQDLLFVHSQQSELDPIVSKTPTLQYRYQKGGGYRVPMTVSEREMSRFLYAVGTNDSPRYYLPEELTPSMCGRQVRIVGGTMDGYEGKLLKVSGSRKKQLLVELPGFFSVGIEVDSDYIQFV